MHITFPKSPIALAAVAALGAITVAALPTPADARGKTQGTYLAGDFHNHSTCSDGAVSMQKLVKRSMERVSESPWGLDWFVQAGHGGTGNRNCTLPEDAALATPAYPQVFATDGVTPLGPQTRWQQSNPAIQPKGAVSGTAPNQNMWRWQAVQEFQYPLVEYLAAYRNEPLFLGIESVVAGHEHSSMAVITGQIPAATYSTPLPTTAGYTPLGNANALAQWAYCFDRGNGDTSRGNTTTTSGIGNNWDCSVPGSPNAADPDWNAAAFKLNGANGNPGHNKTVEAVKWMAAYHPDGSYYVPAHLERAGPFNPAGNNGFNIEHLRNFNNAGPNVAFGFESQPGHGAADQRGEYNIRRNTISGVNVDSAGGTTFGGTGVYAAQIGGVWDALLGEGRNWWFFASSDWHSRGAFSVDDRRSDNDFWPGEYQRNYTMVRHGGSKPTPQTIVDGLRTGNTWVASGQLIDRLAFVACVGRDERAVEALATVAARNNTDFDVKGCASMGEKLVVPPGADVVVSIVVRDPAGKNYSPYSFPNPSLAQVGITQPMDAPVLDHVDVIRGMVTGLRTPGAADYAGAWPDDWVDLANPQQLKSLSLVPAAAKNTSAGVLRTFNGSTWAAGPKGEREYKRMTFRIPAVTASQYVRLRGTNLPAAVPFETDAAGNPLSDAWTNQAQVRAKNSSTIEYPAGALLRIPCKTVGTNVPANDVLYTGTGIDGCPNHLPVVGGQKMVALDVAAWADLWFYSNPIFLEVAGATRVARLK
ncbi:hypothetical protein ACPOLB_07155 [Rubrivivax sp. RP6-9]|uniref:hypothetical protein n=1 Tax=Rubrivivax sp. RP6-9 TaxID=3415750 RepID=UPI003CC52FF8